LMTYAFGIRIIKINVLCVDITIDLIIINNIYVLFNLWKEN